MVKIQYEKAARQTSSFKKLLIIIYDLNIFAFVLFKRLPPPAYNPDE